MATDQPATTFTTNAPQRKPRDDEIDRYGLTHQGLVRKTNQDHFLLASVHRSVRIHQTSLSEHDHLPFGDERMAVLAMIADGVGGGEGGERASRTAMEVASRYIVGSLHAFQNADANDEAFTNTLQDAAMVTHAAVVEGAKAVPDIRSMATTLTLFLGIWPWYYILQIGDSRYYLYRDGKLTQLTRDQTVAQDLVDQGVLKRADAERSRFAHVLSSAIGGQQTTPVVTRLRADWRNVHLMCSDGLTKHVSDERIAERLATMTSSKQAAEALLQDALDGGGSDNITIIVGRAVPRDVSA
jgi:serine/threonine protein phosphatase PrpC